MTAREHAVAVVRRLRDAGHVAYFAGGCVRDQLLGRAPADYDVATDAVPDRVRELFPGSASVGAAFGVTLVRVARGQPLEVATFRADGAYTDGRRPDTVRFTSAEEDARRRDFTINGLFSEPAVDPTTDVAADRIIDFVGGVADLSARVLRAIGNPAERFAEDHLRLLRAVRFAARFDLRIEPATAAAIMESAGSLRRIAPERIAEELRKILTPPTRAIAWPMLRHFGLLAEVLRFMPAADTHRVTGVFLHVSPGQPIAFPLALAAGVLDEADNGGELAPLLADKARAAAIRAIRQALRTSNEETDAAAAILASLADLLDDAGGHPTVARVKRFLATPTADDTRRLLTAVAATGRAVDRIARLDADFAALAGTDVAPPPLINGDHLLAAGFRQGPRFRTILFAVYDAQLEGRVTTRDAAMALAGELAK